MDVDVTGAGAIVHGLYLRERHARSQYIRLVCRSYALTQGTTHTIHQHERRINNKELLLQFSAPSFPLSSASFAVYRRCRLARTRRSPLRRSSTAKRAAGPLLLVSRAPNSPHCLFAEPTVLPVAEFDDPDVDGDAAELGEYS